MVTERTPQRYTSHGRDSWVARSGYQNTPRVPGPVQPMDAEPFPFRALFRLLAAGLGLAALCGLGTLVVVAIG